MGYGVDYLDKLYFENPSKKISLFSHPPPTFPLENGGEKKGKERILSL